MRAKITKLSILISGLFWAISLVAQPVQNPVTVRADTVITCPGPGVHVFVPVHISMWDTADMISSFSIRLNYDTNAVRFVATHNINVRLDTTGMLLTNAPLNDNAWIAAWFTMDTVVPTSDTLAILEFEYLQNWSGLIFDTAQSAVSDNNGENWPTIWQNGLIGLTGPFITTQPLNHTAPSGTFTTFSISGSNITAYQWQSSSDGGLTYTDLSDGGYYSNVTTATLGLTNVNPSLDGMFYRSKATGPCGDQYSSGGKLLVVSTSPIITTVGATSYCAGTVKIPILVTDFYDVKDFTLKVNFNTGSSNILTFSDTLGMNPLLDGSLTVTPSANSLLLHFTGNAEANFGNDTLIQLVFNGTIGTTGFNWDLSTSQYLTPAGSPHYVNFVNANLTVNSLPSSPGIPNGPSAICYSSTPVTYTVASNPNFTSYAWVFPANAGTIVANGNSVDITFNPVFTGTATLTIQGFNGCGGGPISAKFISVKHYTALTITPLSPACINADTIFLTNASPLGGTYSGPGVFNSAFFPDSVGAGTTTITYSFTNTYSCTSSTSTTITVNPLPIVTFAIQPYDSICLSYGSILLSGGDPTGGTYSGPGVNTGNGIFTPTILLIGNQNIKYEFADANGCKSSAIQVLNVDLCNGIENPDANMSVNVQPNPNHGLFEVNIANRKAEANLSIVNNLGQQVYSEKLSPAAGTRLKLDLSNEPSGMYFLMLNCNGNIQVDKIILK